MKISSAYKLTRGEAVETASLLRDAGYSVSQKRCEDYVCNIVDYVAGGDPDAREEVLNAIAESVRLGPAWGR